MSNTQTKRAEFAEKTRYLTAQRAGYRCSLSSCGRITIGPGGQPESSFCIGRAAHIYSAAPGGPRGPGGLTRDELRSPANAIWLCADHADLVDKNRGTDYPPELLLSYKALHEARIARELGGIHTPLGWVERLRVPSSPLFAAPISIDLGKLTLFLGDNGAGKTALCEWLAAVSEPRYLHRWEPIRCGRSRVDIEVRYFDPDSHTARVSFVAQDYPRYLLDGKFTAVPAAPIKVINPGEVENSGSDDQPDDLELLCRVLGLDGYEILALCETLPASGMTDVTRVWFQHDEDGYVLCANVTGTSPGLTFGALSSSERRRVLMTLAILAANQFAERQPTILILDAGAWRLDTAWLKVYGEVLVSPAIGFQTIAAIPTRELNLDELRWAGWKVIRLQGQPPGVTINSDVRVVAQA